MSAMRGVSPQRVPPAFFWVAALFITATLVAQGPPMMAPNGAVNAASFRPPGFPGGNAAPGALISIFGAGFGPAAGIHAQGFPLPEELGPMRTRVMVNDTHPCYMLFANENQINCQLPDAPVGDQIRLRIMTTLGQSGEMTIPYGPHGPGLFTAAANGRGPLLAQNYHDAPDPMQRWRMNGPEETAMSGQPMVLWGTGLGLCDPPAAAGHQAQGTCSAVTPPEVYVGGVRAQVQYAGRAPGFAGLDQIQIEVPDGAPFGCAVPLRIRQGNVEGNVGTVAIGPGSGRCQGPTETIMSGLSHGSIVLSSGLGRLGAGQVGMMAGYGGPYPPYRGPFHGPGMGMGPGGGVNRGGGGVGQYGIGPFGMHPGIPGIAAWVEGPNVATAHFVRLDETAMPDIGIPPIAPGSCNTYLMGPQGQASLFQGTAVHLDAGTISIEGPGLMLTLEPQFGEPGPAYAEAMPGPLEMGAYEATGAGGADVGVFGPVELTVPPLVTVTTSLAPGTQIHRAAGLTLDWTGGNAEDIVLIHGRAFAIPPTTPRPIGDPMSFRSQAFVCAAAAGEMTFSIPDYVMETLPNGLMTINVTHMPSETGVAEFEADGLDLGGVMRWVDSTTYLDLELVP